MHYHATIYNIHQFMQNQQSSNNTSCLTMLILSALRTLEYDKNSIKSCIMSSALLKQLGKGHANLSLYPSV